MNRTTSPWSDLRSQVSYREGKRFARPSSSTPPVRSFEFRSTTSRSLPRRATRSVQTILCAKCRFSFLPGVDPFFSDLSFSSFPCSRGPSRNQGSCRALSLVGEKELLPSTAWLLWLGKDFLSHDYAMDPRHPYFLPSDANSSHVGQDAQQQRSRYVKRRRVRPLVASSRRSTRKRCLVPG